MLATNILLFILIILEVISLLRMLTIDFENRKNAKSWEATQGDRRRKEIREQEDMLDRVNQRQIERAQCLMKEGIEKSKENGIAP